MLAFPPMFVCFSKSYHRVHALYKKHISAEGKSQVYGFLFGTQSINNKNVTQVTYW